MTVHQDSSPSEFLKTTRHDGPCRMLFEDSSLHKVPPLHKLHTSFSWLNGYIYIYIYIYMYICIYTNTHDKLQSALWFEYDCPWLLMLEHTVNIQQRLWGWLWGDHMLIIVASYYLQHMCICMSPRSYRCACRTLTTCRYMYMFCYTYTYVSKFIRYVFSIYPSSSIMHDTCMVLISGRGLSHICELADGRISRMVGGAYADIAKHL